MRLFTSASALGSVAQRTLALFFTSLVLATSTVRAQSNADPLTPFGGPVRLSQPWTSSTAPANSTGRSSEAERGSTETDAPVRAPRGTREVAAPVAGEFENFAKLPRFGSSLINELASGAVDFSPVVPPEYVIQTGDELQVALWGSIDADLRLIVDRAGRITIPRVGPVLVAGVRYGDLRDVITRRVSTVFKNFELSASLGKLRGVRVYVTGFVQRPGAYSVAGLSTVLNAVMRAGGPASAGSFRKISVRRGSTVVGEFDLYDLLLKGDRSMDRIVQPDDVIHVGAVGSQIAFKGSVNQQAVFEMKPGETLGDALRMAGGFSSVADRTRVALERLQDRNATRVSQMPLPASETLTLQDGDVLIAFSAVDSALSVQRQNKRVRVDGEVSNPGELVLPANSTLADALTAAGGLTPSSFLFGAQFTRVSVLETQQQNYDRALRDLETDLARRITTQRVASADEAATLAARQQTNTRLLDRLRELKPNGRVVLNMAPEQGALPQLALEDGDRLYIPARPNTIGVFGSVFNTGTYLHNDGRVLDDYLSLAGGPTKGADQASVFVIRANGQVVSSRQREGWFSRSDRFGRIPAMPGDTIFVPEEMDRTTFMQSVKDWTQVLYQFGLGAAGIATIIK